MNIYVATTNRYKFLEIADILEKYGIETVQKPVDVIEHGSSLEQRAKSKGRK